MPNIMLNNKETRNKYLINDWFVPWTGKKNEPADEEHKLYSKWNLKNAIGSQLTFKAKTHRCGKQFRGYMNRISVLVLRHLRIVILKSHGALESPGISVKMQIPSYTARTRFQFSRSGMVPRNLYFHKYPRRFLYNGHILQKHYAKVSLLS